ncbi:MAG: hypothetical protein R2939_04125 [Kofleriaceae bacterium]
MNARAWVLATGCFVGCGSVNDGTPDAAVDAPPGTVDAAVVSRSLRYERVSIGATVVSEPLDLTGTSATYLMEDATAPSGLREIDASVVDGAWAATLPPGRAQVEFTLPDRPTPLARIFSFDAAVVTDVFAQLAHPAPTAAPVPASLDVVGPVTFPTAYANTTLRLAVIGTWTQYDFSGGERPAMGALTWDPPAVDYAAMAAQAGVRDAMTPADVALLLRYSGGRLDAWAEAMPITMGGGVNALTPVAATMSEVTTDVTVDARVDALSGFTRIGALAPAFDVASSFGQYVVRAAPGGALGVYQGPVLANGNLASLVTDDVVVDASSGNPFDVVGGRQWPATALVELRRSRTYTAAPRSLLLYAGVFALEVPRTDGGDVLFAAPLPTTVVVGGTTLTADNRVVPLDVADAVEVRFALDGAACTRYQATLNAVDDDAGNPASFARRIVVGLSGDVGRWLVPRRYFVDGQRYLVRTECTLGGYRNLAGGDLTDRELPLSVGYLDSPVFTVTTTP